jgi:hypothetical protein
MAHAPSGDPRSPSLQVVRAEAPGFKKDEMWAVDHLHPTATGHAVLAYCILDHVQLLLEGLQLGGKRSASLLQHWRDSLAPPMFLENHHSKGFCGRQGALLQQVWSKDDAWEWFSENDKEGFQVRKTLPPGSTPPSTCKARPGLTEAATRHTHQQPLKLNF